MITINDLALEFDGQKLFSDVNLKFTPQNCYGIIGANGAGKSTFIRLLSGDLEATKGSIEIPKNIRMSVLKQDHFAFDEYTVLDTIIMGNPRLYEIMREKDELYAKEDFSDADGEKAAELEAEFAELDGWEAETNASMLLSGLGLSPDILYAEMKTLGAKEKLRILLAQALFGSPDIILLDEPTNHLDLKSIAWLESFLMDYDGTVIIVSHDRHFLNNVCTHIVDIDYGKIKMYVGNYDFWYESSKLMQRMIKDQNKKQEEKIKELQTFIARFSANKSKSKQATSRKKLLDKITVEEMPASSRKYPFVGFTMDREIGKEVLQIKDVSVIVDGVKVLDKISYTANKGEKVAILSENEIASTALLQLLAGEIEPDEGEIKWGVSTSRSYFPKDNSKYFNDCDYSILDWLRQFSNDETESYLRGFLGKMLFSGDEIYKSVKVLSGGEKVRCMLSRMMLNEANVLILDQVTNHLDLESITAVNNGLSEFKSNIFFSSHDHELNESLANRIIEINPDGSITDKLMGFDEYTQWKEQYI